MRSARWVAAATLVMGTAGSAWGAGDGLMPSDASLWPRWQGRLALGTLSPAAHPDAMNLDSQALRLGGASLLGDYYFSRSLRGVGSGSGFRATSGVILGSRSSSLLTAAPSGSFTGRAFNVDRRTLGMWGLQSPADTGNDPVPYVGLGYTGLAGKGSWGFSADLGVMALNPGSAVKLGRQGLDDSLRDLRLSPMVQLGVSYSF
jgi:hypothetical protein